LCGRSQGKWEYSRFCANLFENYREGDSIGLLTVATLDVHQTEEVAADAAEELVTVLAADVDEH
jgi:hypothetical protein